MQRSLSAGTRTVVAGNIAKILKTHFTWSAPVQWDIHSMKMGRAACHQVISEMLYEGDKWV